MTGRMLSFERESDAVHAPGRRDDDCSKMTGDSAPSLPDALAFAIRLAVKRHARLRAETRRTISLMELPGEGS